MKNLLILLCLAMLPPAICVADDVAAMPTKIMLPLDADATLKFAPSSDQVTLASTPQGVSVAIAPGKDGYPGVGIKPSGGVWDLSQFGHVEARIVNTGDKTLSVSLRVDNAGEWKDNPWNTESARIAPGEIGVVKVIFGYAYGQKPNFALDPSKVVNMVLFTDKAKDAQSFRLESLSAAGLAGEKPPVDPASIRVKPAQGYLLGGGAKLDAVQITAKDAQSSVDENGLRVTFAAKQKDAGSVAVKPPQGRWNLGEAMQVHLRVRNDGTTPILPRARLESKGGASAWATTEKPLAPGAQMLLVVPFDAGQPINLADKTKPSFASNSVSAITIAAEPSDAERVLTVESIVATTFPATIPAWLGKRPPVAGEWRQTLAQEFNDGPIDASIWNVEGENYYDKRTHWSRDELAVSGGMARFNYQKKTGFQNDDPTRKQTPYAAGYMDSYGKWTQRYGYFEARIKLPTAPGLWPAFWLMPDRGTAGDPRWKRQMTEGGGMEFDIMEHLTGWGPNRNNVTMHWDGYDKNHKSLGYDKLYVAPDADGFVTYGLLWLPGQAIYYAQGREIARWENERIGIHPSYILFTLPSGGWDNLPLDDAQLPDAMLVDYVRVWQRDDLATPLDGNKTMP